MSAELSFSSFSSSNDSFEPKPRDFRQGPGREYMAWRPPSSSSNTVRITSEGTINSNNPSRQNGMTATMSPVEATDKFFVSILPDGDMSLSAIAIRAFFLGLVLGISSIITVILLIWYSTPLWRIPFFVSSLCLFHFLEFWVTAQYNTRYAEVSSFLLSSNGAAYNIAHGSAMVECFVSHYWFATSKSPSPNSNGNIFNNINIPMIFALLGIFSMIVGQVVRTLAMATAGSNFNHVVQSRRREGHVLVTGGIYRLLRHPSYFGFFWWGLGTQLVLHNFICFIGYAIVLWQFFKSRIDREERFLISFFGEDYTSYRSRTPVGIPFIA